MTEKITKRLLSGNEAIARGAWEAGVEIASGYHNSTLFKIAAYIFIAIQDDS